jgi:hypothetical protein
MENKIEIAKFKYKNLLKTFRKLNTMSKEYDRTYYKLCGMESILEALGVNLSEIQNEVDTELNN